MIREKSIQVKVVEIKDGPIRVRADSMRKTVIVDIDDGNRKPTTIVLPRSFDVLDSLGVALAHIARVQENWEESDATSAYDHE